MRFQRTSSPLNWCSYIARFPAFSSSPASCAETARVRSITRASRLAVPKHSSDEALVRIAGATTILHPTVATFAKRDLKVALHSQYRLLARSHPFPFNECGRDFKELNRK